MDMIAHLHTPTALLPAKEKQEADIDVMAKRNSFLSLGSMYSP
jgi:hypothetical protein